MQVNTNWGHLNNKKPILASFNKPEIYLDFSNERNAATTKTVHLVMKILKNIHEDKENSGSTVSKILRKNLVDH